MKVDYAKEIYDHEDKYPTLAYVFKMSASKTLMAVKTEAKDGIFGVEAYPPKLTVTGTGRLQIEDVKGNTWTISKDATDKLKEEWKEMKANSQGRER